MRTAITPEQADAVYSILMEHAGERDNSTGDSRRIFVHHVTHATYPADEYRFCGSLGFGGKFRNNGNRDTPYVDYYGEDRNPERDAMVERTNAALAELFAPARVPTP